MTSFDEYDGVLFIIEIYIDNLTNLDKSWEKINSLYPVYFLMYMYMYILITVYVKLSLQETTSWLWFWSWQPIQN